ncbi:hypothetical protein ACGF12_22820 [Kitasatospora sp. NPDC048296]|uniref:hypothetical protein n=1 Tax=Kitasatospora sp. NPDC048296 TaxID=3364048 RepID=UPI00371B9274
MTIDRTAKVIPTRYNGRALRKQMGSLIASASQGDLLAVWLWTTEGWILRAAVEEAVRQALPVALGACGLDVWWRRPDGLPPAAARLRAQRQPADPPLNPAGAAGPAGSRTGPAGGPAMED